MKQNNIYTWQRALPYVLLLCGMLGLIASFALTYDKIHVLQDASYRPGCNLNPVLSCGSVMQTSQAMLFGVPNTIFGLAAFGMLSMFGLAILAGAQFKRWLWLGALGMAAMGVAFMHYLFFQSVFRIHAICPWCFLVWMVTIPVFFGILLHTLRAGYLKSQRLAWLKPVARFINNYSTDLLVLWYAAIFAVLLIKFWYYWQTLLP